MAGDGGCISCKKKRGGRDALIGYPSANHQINKVMKHEFTVHWKRATGRAYRYYSRSFDEVERAIEFARKKHEDGALHVRIHDEFVEHYETGNNAPGIKDGVRIKILGFVEF